MENKSQVFQAFELLEKKAPPKTPSWLGALRKEAISRFAELDFPTLRDEEWRYTSVEPIVRNSFRFTFDSSHDGLTAAKLDPFLPSGLAGGVHLVFVNGVYSKELSSPTPHAPQGIRAGSLAEMLASDPRAAEPLLARLADSKKNIFTALNTAFLFDGAFIHIEKEKNAREPIQLVFVSLSGREKAISQPRNLVFAEEGACATIIETYPSPAADSYFTNAVTEVFLADGAKVEHVKIQNESKNAFHMATIQVSVGRDAEFHSHSVFLGAGLSRNNLNVMLNREGASVILNGLYLAAGNQHTDHHTMIDHLRPRGRSRQLYKGILDGQSRAVFNGKIFVRRDAQKTDAHQTNKNLLLSEGATVDTKPQLEIDADDVACAHGAAVGTLDESMIFYAKSRGIGEEGARAILTHGFANELIGEIQNESIRSHLDNLVWNFLKENLKTEAGTP